MADPLDVELVLRRAAAAVDVTGAATVLAAVTGRVDATGMEPARVRWLSRRHIAVAAAVVFVATMVLTFSPRTREAVARLIGLPGVEFVRLDALPPATDRVELPELGLGEPTTIAAARGRLPYEPRQFDGALRAPDGVYLDGAALSYVYRSAAGLPTTSVNGVGLLITQFDGTTGPEIVRKVTVRDDQIQDVSVGGRRGLWIEGEHAVAYLDRTDDFVEVPLRLAGNVLLWSDAGVTFRLEANVSRDDAIALAERLTS